MGRRFTSVKGFDAFGKTMDDVKVKTGFGGLLTLVSLSLILSLTLYEFIDYRRVHWVRREEAPRSTFSSMLVPAHDIHASNVQQEPSIIVDKSRGEKLVVNLDIDFPRVPCYLLSVDIMDISGEHQNDIHHDITKTRLSKDGKPLDGPNSKDLKGELEKVASQKGPDYCGSCYGGTPPTEGPNPGCCNSCEDVREAYVRRGWSFVNPDAIEQCVSEGWSDKIKEQSDEGCNVAGKVRVNKVIGNFHLSPGRSFQSNSMHVHDLVPYLQSGNKHDFGHHINSFYFSSETEDEFVGRGGVTATSTKKVLGIVNPLDGYEAHTEESNYMFQMFLKVVSTKFSFLDGRELNTHQYSVTQYERDLTNNKPGKDAQGHQTTHGYAGVPGLRGPQNA
ncbi:ER-derived vesicles protein erv46 [Microbotryomycetes sp. JL221]|nr:ER-derived vesicles protein erv46 [Microbotryomycetes sp. JL221]